jgi:hypothetical protein
MAAAANVGKLIRRTKFAALEGEEERREACRESNIGVKKNGHSKEKK